MTFEALSSEVLYEAHLTISAIVDYGYHLDALLSGGSPVPAGGARFDVAFEGTVRGERIEGEVSGTDYLVVRADGRMMLHIHARLLTADGAPVSFLATGLAVPDDKGLLHIHESVTLYSSNERYEWLNGLPIWARGTVSLQTQEVRVIGYVPVSEAGPDA